MTTLSLTDVRLASLPADAVVVGVHSADNRPVLAPGATAADEALGGRLVEVLVALGATGSSGEVTKVATLGALATPVLVAVGLGSRDDEDDSGNDSAAGNDVDADAVRGAAGSAVRALAGLDKVALALPLLAGNDTGRTLALTAAAAEGALLGAYDYVGYRTTGLSERKDPVTSVALVVPDARDRDARAAVHRATTVATAVGRARDWVNTPGNLLRPPGFADQAAEVAARAGLEVEVLDEKKLRRGGYGGILAVGGGSDAPPRLVRLHHKPSRAGRHAPSVALVGKGITFDTGGVSIKPSQGMWEMKGDMAGAAAIIATMSTLPELDVPVPVTAYVPMAENMPSGSAYRPGDVVTMYGGKTVEVLNTDAEGRMVLADAMARACEDNPAYLLETATLTGGQVVALGTRYSGVMGTPELCERVKTAGELVGEKMWPMPLPDELRTAMESPIADVLQVHTGMERSGHMLQGGIFLSNFVSDDVAWAHIDIAGPSSAKSASGYLAKGATGVPVRTLLAVLEDIGANG